jgi:hypothetical protein
MVNLGKLLAEQYTHGDSAQPVVAKKRVKRDVNAPKKNYSSYLHYCMSNRERLMKAHPAMAQPDVAKLLGEEWRNLTDAQKEVSVVYPPPSLSCPYPFYVSNHGSSLIDLFFLIALQKVCRGRQGTI